MTFEPHQHLCYRTDIEMVGRVAIPAELRARQGLHSGDEIAMLPHDGSLELNSNDQVLCQARYLFCNTAPQSRVLSGELIAERSRDSAIDD